jgi:hypothetical protein
MTIVHKICITYHAPVDRAFDCYDDELLAIAEKCRGSCHGQGDWMLGEKRMRDIHFGFKSEKSAKKFLNVQGLLTIKRIRCEYVKCEVEFLCF